MKLSIIIPVYNEEKTFTQLIEKVLNVELPIEKELIIVEGGSTDGTKSLIHKYDSNPSIKTFYLKRYSGKGYKVKYGLRQSTGDIILIQDADLEYNPDEYSELIKPIIEGKTKFVLGSRHLGCGTWKIRKFDYSAWRANLINFVSILYYTLFWFLYGVRLTDPQTMYKVFKRECLKGIKFKSNQFQLDWEIVIKLVKKGYIPLEVPVSYNCRTFKEGKKTKLIQDGFLALWAILKYRFVN
ncbi:MAG: glycosyltransferase family 2 protein [Nanoarchaeota archaeon]